MISRCKRPRKPQRKPKPSAADVSISKLNEASLRRSLYMLSRSFSKSLASTGKRPQNTTGCASLKPGRGAAVGLFASVIVSPPAVCDTSLICAVMKPIRSEEHTSDLQYLMRNSYAVFCLEQKTHINTP